MLRAARTFEDRHPNQEHLRAANNAAQAADKAKTRR
jgi:hypothetical protein